MDHAQQKAAFSLPCRPGQTGAGEHWSRCQSWFCCVAAAGVLLLLAHFYGAGRKVGPILFRQLPRTEARIGEESIPLRQQDRRRCAPLPSLHLDKTRIQWESQWGQDQLVDLAMGSKIGGFFVDLAANDPQCISNSWFLEKWRGWHGLCIEANPLYIPFLSRHRNCTVIHSAVDETPNRTVQFEANGAEGRIAASTPSTRNPKAAKERSRRKIKLIDVKTRDLGEILDAYCAPRVMDFLSLDVEGNELRVMKSFPFDRYQFNIMMTEGNDETLTALLRQNGYQWVRSIKVYGDGKLKSVGVIIEQLWLHTSFLGNLSKQKRQKMQSFRFPSIGAKRWKPRCLAPSSRSE